MSFSAAGPLLEAFKITFLEKRTPSGWLVVLSVLFVGLGISLILIPRSLEVAPLWTTVAAIVGIILISTGLVLGLSYAYRSRYPSYESSAYANEMLARAYETAQERADAEPEKAKPAWDLARVTLEQYFNRNLSQIRSIFRLSVFVMLVGFGFILYGIWLGLRNPDAITLAIIGGVAGILTEFIGATFLYLYRSTVEQAAKYTITLERMNSVGMAMSILDTVVEEESEKLLDAKIEVALRLLGAGTQPENPSS